MAAANVRHFRRLYFSRRPLFLSRWLGNPGKGRALGVGTVKFTGEVLQNVKNVRYEIDMKKIMSPGGTTVGLANGLVFADDKKI